VNSYKLECVNLIEDLHDFLTRKYNVIVAELFTRFYRKNIEHRKTVTWYNEDEGARVEVVHEDAGKKFEEVVIDTLNNLKHFLVSGKIDVNVFRQEIGRLTFVTYYRAPLMYPYLKEILLASGCSLTIKSSRKLPTEEMLKQYTKYMESLGQADQRDIAGVKIIVQKDKKPLSNYDVKIYVETPEKGIIIANEATMKTGDNGELIIPVKKYSEIKITTPNKIKEATVIDERTREILKKIAPNDKYINIPIGSNNVKVVLNVKRRIRSYLLIGYFLIGLTALITLLALLSLLS